MLADIELIAFLESVTQISIFKLVNHNVHKLLSVPTINLSMVYCLKQTGPDK